MNWLDFISSIVGSVAWPFAIVIASLIFRGPLSQLLKRITEVEVFGNKAVFSDELKKAELVAEALPAQIENAEPPLPPDEAYLKLANLSPPAAVMESYKKVAAVIDEWQNAQGMTHPPTNEGFVDWLLKDGALSAGEYDLYRTVRQTRNIAVHSNSSKITAGEAIAYKDLCDNLAGVLRRAIRTWEGRR
jgi:hypothetical protein